MGLISVHMAVIFGRLTAARNSIRGEKFDRDGGWSEAFSVELQHAGGGGPAWFGGVWTMYRTAAEARPDEPDLETFVVDVINGAPMNTGGNDVQWIVHVHEDEYPGITALQGWGLFLADLTIKPWALERVPLG